MFRFRRKASSTADGPISPFTEVPAEIRRGFMFGRLVQKILNFLFLLILGIALLGLVIAFAYQMIYHPDVLQAQASSIVTTIRDFIQGLVGAAK